MKDNYIKPLLALILWFAIFVLLVGACVIFDLSEEGMAIAASSAALYFGIRSMVETTFKE